jgi:hypothetical protein
MQFLQSLQANQRPVELSFDNNPTPMSHPAVNFVDNPTGSSAFDFVGSSSRGNAMAPPFMNQPMMPMGMQAHPMMMPNQGFNPYSQQVGYPPMGFAPAQQLNSPFPFNQQQVVTPDKNKKLDQQLGNIFK